MTIAEDRLIEAVKELLAEYDENGDEYLYGPLDRLRSLIKALEPRS